jgi:hypothetical protein
MQKKGSARTCNIIVPKDNSKRARPFYKNLSKEHKPYLDLVAKLVTKLSYSRNKEIYYLVSSRYLMLASP